MIHSRTTLGVITISAALLATGCNSGTGEQGGSTTATSPALAADVPKGFDPCTQIPADVMSGERLKATDRKDTDAPGGVKWRGCGWVIKGGSGYGLGITTTNLTLDMVRSRNFPDAQEFTAGSRQAISTRRPNDDTACWVNVDMRGGSLEFLVDNPKSNKDTGHLDSCQIGRDLAGKVVPYMPATA